MNKWISLLLAVVLVVLSLPVPSQAAAFPDTDRIIVSMGDSYSAGEGMEPFYNQDLSPAQKVKDEDWLAHRSRNSWPGRLTLNGVAGSMAQNRNENWYFVAASGAKTCHISGKQKKTFDYEGQSGEKKLTAQIQILKDLKEQGKRVDYVTITIGGNDADFVKVVEIVAKQHSSTNRGALPAKISSVWNTYESTIKQDLIDTYTEITKAAPGATLIVVGYPLLFESTDQGKGVTGSGPLINKDEAKLVNDAVHSFNGKLEGLVEGLSQQGMQICFVSVEEGFYGHEAYAEDGYINEIDVSRNDEDLESGPSAYSMHPNTYGAQVYARCVQAKIDQLEKERGFDQLQIPVKKLSRLVMKENGTVLEDYTFHYTGDLLTSINVSQPVYGISGTLRFSYDSGGRLLSADNGGMVALYGNRQYAYNSAGQMTEYKVYWYGATTPTERFTYAYDSQGGLSEAKVYYLDPGKDSAEHSITYTYTNTYRNGALTERCGTVKWIDEDYRIVNNFGEFYASEMLAVTRYSYQADGKLYTEKFVEMPGALYDPGGNHQVSRSDWHTTTRNNAYYPLVVMETDDSHNLVIFDKGETGVWSIYLGDARYEMDSDNYISKVTDKDNGYTYELTFVD